MFDSGKYHVERKNAALVRRLLDEHAGGSHTATTALPDAKAGRNPNAGRNVFVVYGHDEHALAQLEAMLLARLGRSRVAILLKEGVGMEPPSDMRGHIYIGFDKSVEDRRAELVREMTNQGIDIAVESL